MGCCESKRSNPEPVQQPVKNVLQEKHVLLVDMPQSTQQSSASSSGFAQSPKSQPKSQEYATVKTEAPAASPAVSNSPSTDPLYKMDEPSVRVENPQVESNSPRLDDPAPSAEEAHLASVEIEHAPVDRIDPVIQESVVVVDDDPFVAPSMNESSPGDPVKSKDVPTPAPAAEPAVEPATAVGAADDSPTSEEPAVKYSEIDRIASFNLGHNDHHHHHHNTPAAVTTRESEHDQDRLKHFQKLGSATVVQGRQGPLMAGRGGKNRRSSTQHFPTETPIVVNPRSAEI